MGFSLTCSPSERRQPVAVPGSVQAKLDDGLRAPVFFGLGLQAGYVHPTLAPRHFHSSLCRPRHGQLDEHNCHCCRRPQTGQNPLSPDHRKPGLPGKCFCITGSEIPTAHPDPTGGPSTRPRIPPCPSRGMKFLGSRIAFCFRYGSTPVISGTMAVWQYWSSATPESQAGVGGAPRWMPK